MLPGFRDGGTARRSSLNCIFPMNKKTVLGAVAVIALASYGGSTWYLGGEVQNRYETALADVQKALGTQAVLTHTYERGFLSSRAKVALQWNPDPSAPEAGIALDQPLVTSSPRFVANSTLRHGPLAGVRLAAAVVETQFSMEGLDKPMQKMLATATGPTLTSVHRLTGGQDLTISLPAGEVAGAEDDRQHIQWQAMTFQVAISADQARVSGNLQWPGMSMKGLNTQELNANARNEEREEDGERPGLAMPDAAAAAGRYAISVQGMGGDFDMQLQNGLWLLAPGTASGQIEQITVTSAESADPSAISKTVLNLEQLTYTVAIKRTGDTLGWTTKVAGKGDMGDLKFEALNLQEAVDQVDVQALKAFQDTLLTTYRNAAVEADAEQVERSAAVLSEIAPRFVAAKPSYSMKISATLGGRQGGLEYSAQINQAPAEQLVQAMGWGPALLASSSLNASAQVPKIWLPLVATAVTGARMPAEQIDGLIDMVTAQGYVVQEADQLSTALRFEGGQLQLNGKTIPMPGLGG